ncbi:MAG: hypothetical protein ACI93R_000661 [Flavobacteriales bacterium]
MNHPYQSASPLYRLVSAAAYLFALLYIAIQSSIAHAQPKTNYHYSYWDWGKTPKRDAYQVELLTLALDATRSTHGEYSISRVRRSYTTNRVRREINLGDVVNIRVGAWISEAQTDLETNIAAKVPILNQMMGFRSLIVHKDSLVKFAGINTAEQLQTLTAGQGRGWQDSAIYRHSNYQVIEADDMDSLASMQGNKRFDYLPLAAIEAQSFIDKHPDIAPKLAIVPELMVFYPYPIVFYLSSKQAYLAQRLELGLEALKEQGKITALLNKHFAEHMRVIQSKNTRYIMLENPFIPPELAIKPNSLQL